MVRSKMMCVSRNPILRRIFFDKSCIKSVKFKIGILADHNLLLQNYINPKRLRSAYTCVFVSGFMSYGHVRQDSLFCNFFYV